jgi:Domain of unknown function (DUF4340)
MTEIQKTLAFVGVAVVLTGAAYLTRPARIDTAAIDDQGQKFFPELNDPLAATSLEVVDYDPATAHVIPFKVELDVAAGAGGKKRWVIPSHFDYPADAQDRLARTAAGIFELRKDTIRSDRAEDHKGFGVIDPLDTKTTTLTGRGKRVTLRDASGKVLADLIVGNEVGSKEEAAERGMRYVRLPGKDRTYGVKITADLSAQFTDWIEPNLLGLQSDRVRRLVFDNHKVDPEARAIIPGEVLAVARPDSSGTSWAMEGLAPDQEVNADKVSGATEALADLKIVGVRPMPESLVRDLQSSAEGKVSPTTEEAYRSLVSKGFYPVRNGFYSNQGEVRVGTDEGVLYRLRFGEVTFAQGEALSAGAEEDQAPAGPKDAAQPAGKKAEGATESRFLFVTVEFDPSLIPPPPPASKPEGPPTLPENVFTPKPEERAAQEKADKEKADKEKAEQDRKIADGKKRVDELAARFAGWYYVTPGDSFRSIALDRAGLVRKKGETTTPAAGAIPSDPFSSGDGRGPRMPGLPPGHP